MASAIRSPLRKPARPGSGTVARGAGKASRSWNTQARTTITSGKTTYGAGRYVLDTVKGSDLGGLEGTLVLDFNFSYNPSCSYDPRWDCPLAPPPNWLKVPVEAGERYG